jgi:hypothetical protein
MRAFDVLFTRRARPIAGLLLLIAAGFMVHRLAVAHAEVIGSLALQMEPAAAARVRFVNHVNTQPWLILTYFAAFVAALAWMQVRQLPRWSLWLTFFFLSFPVFGYFWICFRISSNGTP